MIKYVFWDKFYLPKFQVYIKSNNLFKAFLILIYEIFNKNYRYRKFTFRVLA